MYLYFTALSLSYEELALMVSLSAPPYAMNPVLYKLYTHALCGATSPTQNAQYRHSGELKSGSAENQNQHLGKIDKKWNCSRTHDSLFGP